MGVAADAVSILQRRLGYLPVDGWPVAYECDVIGQDTAIPPGHLEVRGRRVFWLFDHPEPDRAGVELLDVGYYPAPNLPALVSA